jgi:hypothetical protein
MDKTLTAAILTGLLGYIVGNANVTNISSIVTKIPADQIEP